MDGSIDMPKARLRLRCYLKRILFVLQLPGRMAFNTPADLDRQRDDCGRAAYSIAFWTVEEFEQFNLPAPPTPSAQQPGLSEAQLKAWTLGVLRRLDGEDDPSKSVRKPSGPGEKVGAGQTPFTDTEDIILTTLGNDHMTGPVLLKKAGYDNSSHYRQILSNLVKRAILGNDHTGYFRRGT